jgi:hypothetical protein
MRLHLRLGDAGKLAERLRAPLTHQLGELSLEVSEVKKRTRGSELLPLKEHGRPRPQEHHSGQGFVLAGTGQPMAAQAAAGVGDLVVVLKKGHKRRRLQSKTRRTATLLLPGRPLPLVEVAPLERRDKLLGSAAIVGVIGLVVSGKRYHGAVVKVIVPEGVEAIAALRWWAYQLGVLPFVLRHQEGGPPQGSDRARLRVPLPHASAVRPILGNRRPCPGALLPPQGAAGVA